MLDILGELYTLAIKEEITILFSRIIIGVFVIGVVSALWGYKLFNAGRLTSLGILGTFIGISLALFKLDFRVEHINNSIQDVIKGMEVAFISSVLGIFLSLVYSAICSMRFDLFGKGKNTQNVTLATINNTLQHIQKSIEKANTDGTLTDIKNSVDSVKDAISGDGDSSLNTQLQKIRNENRDGFEKLDTSFTQFAEKVSELGTKAIIEALEQVIRDFNNNLTEQFGENFKQLNQAVEKLVNW